jgi:proteasome lid subunit RPN8/RPN11
MATQINDRAKASPYPDYVLFHLPAFQEAERRLLATALHDSTEEAVCLYGYVVRTPQNRFATWVCTVTPTVRKATPTFLEIEPKTFIQAGEILSQTGRRDQRLVGWWHSHPRMGLQPSSIDVNTQHTHFHDPWMLMVISNPHSCEVVVYRWHAPDQFSPVRFGLLVDSPQNYLDTSVDSPPVIEFANNRVDGHQPVLS